MITLKNIAQNAIFAFAAFILLVVPASFVQADGEDWLGVWNIPSGGNYYPDTYSNYYPDTYSNYYPDTYSNYYPDSYDYSSPYSSGYGSSMPFSSGFSQGGGFGGFQLPYQQSMPPHFSNSNTNISTCGAINSCNSYVDDHSIFSAPTTVTIANNNLGTPSYQQPVAQQVYQPYYPQVPSQPRAPYVTLSAVPYTGLELGPVGTMLYWSFLVLWCLAAAYLIVVKRVQVKLMSWLNGMLFSSTAVAATATHTVSRNTASVAKAKAAPRAEENSDAIDSFILSQVSR